RTLSLRPGTYAVRGRTRDALLDGKVVVVAGLETVVDASKLDRATYASLVRKGKGEILGGVSGPFVGTSVVTSVLYGLLDGSPGVVAGWTWVRLRFTLSPRISAWRRSVRDDAQYTEAKAVTLDVRVSRVWDLGRFSLDLGLALGGGGGSFRHVFIYPSAPSDTFYARYPAAHIDATLGMNLPLWGRTYLGAEVATQLVLTFRDGRDEAGTLLTMNLFLGAWL
ncbi:MAG TPA: hypothetical protein VN253_07375, partial [Kofleriaceae bacterium]|nr:hypothetical protein [Kofleriaceae bacterium]